MTIQELKALVKSVLGEDSFKEKENGWGEIENGIQKTVEAQTTGLHANKEKILTEKKQLQEKYDEIAETLKSFEDAGITVEEFSNLKSEIESLKASQSSNRDVDTESFRKRGYEEGKKAYKLEVTPRIEELQSSLTALQKKQEEMMKKHIEDLKVQQLDKVISDLRIETDPYFIKGFYASAKVEYNDMDDSVTIELPAPNSDKTYIPISDWKNQFPNTDEGKKRIRVITSGGGATGQNGRNTKKEESLVEQIGDLFSKKA